MSHFSEDIMFQYTKTKVEPAEFFPELKIKSQIAFKGNY